MERLAEDAHVVDEERVLEERQGGHERLADDLEPAVGGERLLVLHRVRLPAHQKLPIVDVGDPRAALRLVHVVGGEEERGALPGEEEEEVPEEAARDRVHARRRLVEKEDPRPVDERAGERETLLEAAREAARRLPRAPVEAAELDELPLALPGGDGRDTIGVPVEVEVLPHGEVGVEAELL